MKLDSTPRGSLGARVTERLRSAILDGELELGDALSEDKLAKILGVSRSPVREALAALEQQGLIDVKPQRGSFVFLPSQEDTNNLCEFRRAVELEALRLAMQRAPEKTVAALRQAAEDMREAIEAGDTLASARADDRFHDAALGNSGNPYLVNAYRLASGKVAALRSHRSAHSTRKQANSEHLAIIALLEKDDLDGALETLSNHILKMAERYFLHQEPAPAPTQASRRAGRGGSLDHLGPLLD